MDSDDMQIIYLRTKLRSSRLRGPRKRKVRQPSTPQLRKRREAAKLVPISAEGVIRFAKLPPGWTVGRRVFWTVGGNDVAIGALKPIGALQHGRYYSSRLRIGRKYLCSY